MREGWEMKSLNQVCKELFAGGDVPKGRSSKFITKELNIPIYSNGAKNKGLYGYTDVPRVTENSITVSARGTIGYSEIRRESYLPVVRLIVLIPDEKLITLPFLKYVIETLDFGNSGTSIPQLTVPMIKKNKAYIPPLSEQKQIVAILDQAFAAIDQAKVNIEKNIENAKELFQSKLNEIFSRKGEGWEEKRLEEICKETKNIKWQDNIDQEFKYVDLSSVSRETLLITETSTITDKTAPSRAKKIVIQNDVIFATTRPTLKRVTMIDEDLENQICSTGYVVLRGLKNKINPKWIFYFIQTDFFIRRMETLQRGASYPAVSDKDVKGSLIRYPRSLEEQKKYICLCDKIIKNLNNIQSNYKQKLEYLEELKKSLLQKAFAGELTGKELAVEVE